MQKRLLLKLTCKVKFVSILLLLFFLLMCWIEI